MGDRAARDALLLVDLQVAHLDPDRGLGSGCGASRRGTPTIHDRVRELVLPNVARLQAFFREHGRQLVYTRLGLLTADGRDLAPWSWQAAAQRETADGRAAALSARAPERELWPTLAPRPDELVLDTTTLSPFNSTALDQYLRNMGVENLVVAGVADRRGGRDHRARCRRPRLQRDRRRGRLRGPGSRAPRHDLRHRVVVRGQDDGRGDRPAWPVAVAGPSLIASPGPEPGAPTPRARRRAGVTWASVARSLLLAALLCWPGRAARPAAGAVVHRWPPPRVSAMPREARTSSRPRSASAATRSPARSRGV